MPRTWTIGALVLAALTAGCATDATDTDTDTDTDGTPVVDKGSLPPQAEVADRCDPLDPSVCALPFPSSHFLVADPNTPTGVRVAFQETTLPVNLDGVKTLPTYFNERDGFAIAGPMLTYFEDVSLDGTIPVRDIGAYEAADAKTVILDTVTGERVPHWVEIDATTEDPDQQLLILRPAVPFEFGRRYVVGIRGLSKNAGGPVDVSPAFAALRDGTTGTTVVEARRDWFDTNVFPYLTDAGISRADLQLAWDFTTASRTNTLGRALWMRDDALAWVDEQGGIAIELDPPEDHDCSKEGELIARDLSGTFKAPLYMEFDQSEDIQKVGVEALLTRDANGQPFRNGTTEVDFLVRVPCSVANGPDGTGPVAASAPVLQYGHGLLGSRGEAKSGWLARFADERGVVILALDWTGFMEDDVAGITLMLANNVQDDVNPTHFSIIPERSMQGLVEQVLGMRMALTTLKDDPALTFGSVKVIDPARPYYWGNSQGAILGSSYLPMSPDIQRGILGVGGGPYSLLLPRSRDFDPFFAIFRNKYDDHREIMLFVAGLTQHLWEASEPGGWMWEMNRDAEDPKQVLMQVAIYDNQVTTKGAAIQARAFGAVIDTEAVRPVWGVPSADFSQGHTGSALVEYKYDWLPDEPTSTLPPGSREAIPAGYEPPDGLPIDPHECPRRELSGQDQAWEFLETGVVKRYCPPGGCVSSTCGTPGR